MNELSVPQYLEDEDRRAWPDETDRLIAAAQSLAALTSDLALDEIGDLRLRELINELPDFFYVKDRQSRFVFANAPTLSTLGLKDVSQLRGYADKDMMSADFADGFYQIEQDLMARGEPRLNMEELVPDPYGGKPVCRLTSKIPLRNERDEVIGLIGISRDITERKRQEHLHRGQAALLEMIAKSEPLEMILEALVLLVEEELVDIRGSILLLDTEGVHLYHGAAPHLPAAYSRLIDGIAIGPKVGSCGTAAWHGKPAIVCDIQTDPRWEEFRGIAAQFELRSCWSTPIMTPQGNVLGTFALYSGTVREPTAREKELVAMATYIAGIAIDRKRAEDRIYFMAHHDDLTGLPNRSFLKESMARILFNARRNGRKVTVAYIDLDNFKDVNDSLGHGAGDELLKEVAARMVDGVRASDIVVRLGGDEFLAVIVHQSRHDAGIARRLEELREAITQPVRLRELEVSVSASLGVASFPADGESAEELLANADVAMYKAKKLGRNRVQYYDSPADVAAPALVPEHEELRQAIGMNQLFLEYQPQVDVATGRIVGVEALVRWRHPRRGLLSPDKFISLAEETGLIIPLGLWVLNEACRQNKLWQDIGLPPVVVAVNVSPRQFGDPELADHVAEALMSTGLAAQWLEIELTESTLMQDAKRAIDVMDALRDLGVKLSIDDFGTGYSSLSALKTFPFHRLKMDRSLVEALPGDATAVAICSAVISLAHTLKLVVVAEGVETFEQFEFLRQSGCDEAQGYRFSRPVAPEDIEPILQRVA